MVLVEGVAAGAAEAPFFGVSVLGLESLDDDAVLEADFDERESVA